MYDGNNQPIAQSAIGNRFLFHRKEYSWKTGLYLNGARWYDPVVGRFISKDPSGIANGFNEYEFCYNNPVCVIDPDGESGHDVYNWVCKKTASGYNRGGFWGGLGALLGNATATVIDLTVLDVEDMAAIAGMYDGKGEHGEALKYAALTGAIIGLNAVPGGGKAGGKIVAAAAEREVAEAAAKKVLAAELKAAAREADQRALRDLVNEATMKGQKPLSKQNAETVLDWARETEYPGLRANPGDLAQPSNWKANPVPHIHLPGAGRGGHVPVAP